MRKLGVEDLKHIENLTKGLKRAKFQDVSGPEILALAFAFQWLADLKVEAEKDMLPPPSSLSVSSPIKSDKKKK